MVAIDISLSPKVESSEEGLQIHRARKAQTTSPPALLETQRSLTRPSGRDVGVAPLKHV